MQQPILNAQIVLPDVEAPTGISFMMFSQNLGGAVFISVAQSLFTDELARELVGIPELGLSKKQIVEMGATTIRGLVEGGALEILLEYYRVAIRNAFLVGLALACFSAVGALGVEWRSVKEKKEKVVAAEGSKTGSGEKVDV